MSKTLVYVDGSGWNGREVKYCVLWGTAGGEWKHKIVRSHSEKTNNEMEYEGVIHAMREFKKAAIFSDSELVVNQVNGVYKVRQAHLMPLRDEARRLMKLNGNTLVWVPRDENKAGVILDNGKGYE